MLVLSRKTNESINMTLPDGTVIKMCVVEIRGDKVRLGFDAPNTVVIDREEVSEAKKRVAARERSTT